MGLRKQIEEENLFILSTDTVVGIGGILNENIKQKLKIIKNDPKRKFFAILVDSIKTAREFSEWSNKAEKLAKQYWPGPVTIALKTYGLRMPNSKKVLRFLHKVGPIYLTSANMHGNKPLSFEDAIDTFKKDIKIYLNYSKVSSGIPSTIISASDNRIIRKGELKL